MNGPEILALLLSLAFGNPTTTQSGQETVLKMPAGQDVFFKEYAYTHSQYVHFLPNGTYRRIDRQHMGVREKDHGTWTQKDTGEITLVSPEHYRNIECSPLSVFTWFKDDIDRLLPLKAALAKLLARKPAKSFRPGEIRRIETCGYNNCLWSINVDFDTRSVSREELSALIRSIDEFLSDPQKNHFHLTPMTYKGVTFLLWKDAETPINRNLKEIKERIDEAKDLRSVTFIYLGIDKRTFEKESGRTQEFIFHPEMNKCIPQNQVPSDTEQPLTH